MKPIGIYLLFNKPNRCLQLIDNCFVRYIILIMGIRKIIWFSIGFGALYWIIDSVIDALMFGGGTPYEHIFFPEPIELRMRLLALFIIIAFGLFTQNTLFKQKKAEELLQQQSEERYQNLVENAPEVLYTLSTDGTITSLNPAFEIITGWPCPEWVGKPFMPLIHPDDLPRAIETFQKILQGEKISSYELRVLSKSGEYLTGEFTSAPQTKNGKVTGEYVIVRDITERKKADEALRESEKRYKQLVDSVTDYIYTVEIENSKPVSTKHGTGCVSVTGYTSDEYAADPYLWFRMIHEEDLKAVLEQANRILLDGVVPPLEHRIIHKDGSIRWVRNTALLRYDKEGKLVAYDGLISDITERKQAKELLIETTRALQLLINSSPLAIIAVDPEGIVTLWNPAAERIFGWKEHEVLGHLNPIVPEDKVDEFRILYGRTLKGELLIGLELRRQRKDGTMIYISLSTAPIYDAKGSITGVMGVISDITERKNMEEQIYEITHDWEDTFNSIIDMVTVHDKDWNIIRANKAAEKILHLPILEKTKEPKCFRYYHGTEKPPEGCPSCQCLQTGMPAIFELFEPHLNMFIEIRAIPRFDSNNNLRGLIHVVRDITARKKIEEELKNRVLELEKFYEMAVGRELKMKELKEEIKRLKTELSKYKNNTDAR